MKNVVAESGIKKELERERGFEPPTLALARRCSTTELFPLCWNFELILVGTLEAVKQRRIGYTHSFFFKCNKILTE
jgi:hypothetical protein